MHLAQSSVSSLLVLLTRPQSGLSGDFITQAWKVGVPRRWALQRLHLMIQEYQSHIVVGWSGVEWLREVLWLLIWVGCWGLVLVEVVGVVVGAFVD